jgi:ppGpp synthetase/RelA/SpoT-type nucleotidyltranferase
VLPASKSQLSRLGKRLAAGAPAPGDRELYAALLDAYEDTQVGLVEILSEADWGPDMPVLSVRGRTKSRDTLLDKLRRAPDVQLPYIRDIAGIRLVGDLTLTQQTAVGDELVQRFGGRLIDRRAEPQAGYRALHVALMVDGVPVEAQVRTQLQHLWAEVFERLADQWGRQLRYGGLPNDPGPNGDVPLDQRIDFVAVLQDLSVRAIDAVEVMREVDPVEEVAAVTEEAEHVLLTLMKWLRGGATSGAPASPTLEES